MMLFCYTSLMNLKNISKIKELTKLSLTKDVLSLTHTEKQTKWWKKHDKSINIYKITYRSGKCDVTGYVIEPKKDEVYPAVISCRGGSRDFGQVSLEKLWGPLADLAQEGYVVFVPQYRGVDGGEGQDDWGGPDTIQDILSLKPIINNYDKCDPKRIGIIGHSRGGLMVAKMMTKVKWLKAAVMGSSTIDTVRSVRTSERWKDHMASFGIKTKKNCIDRSPLYWVDKLNKKTPLLLVQGTSDWRVSADYAIDMAKRLQEHEHPYRFVMYDGADHGITEHRHEYRNEIKNWLNRFVRDGEKLPDMKPHGF